MKRRAWLQAAASGLAFPSWLLQAAQAPRRHALLVGVSALAQQPADLWLQGPRHDVPAMQQALQAHGFAPADITVLADDGSGQRRALPGAALPERAALLQALTALRSRLAPGDAVVLYWSGHAVRAPGPPKRTPEADGQSTFLLCHDAVRTAPGHAWPLHGAIADAELGAHIDDWLTAGAHVLVVMDSCHAASTTRDGADGIRWRGLRVSELQDLHAQPSILAPSATQSALPARLPDRLPDARPRSAGFVGLYACEDMQRTPEWQIQGRPQGIFTHALLQALATAHPTQRYSRLAQHTLEAHQQQLAHSNVPPRQWPTPVLEGSLQAPLWQRRPLPAMDPGAGPDSTPRPLPAGVTVSFQVQQPGRPVQRWSLGYGPQPQRTLGRLPVGTQMVLRIFNASRQALYLRVWHADPQGRWHGIYPALAGDAALLPAGHPQQPARWEQTLVIDQAEAQPEALLCLLAPAQSAQWLQDSLPQAPLPEGWHTTLRWQAVPA